MIFIIAIFSYSLSHSTPRVSDFVNKQIFREISSVLYIVCITLNSQIVQCKSSRRTPLARHLLRNNRRCWTWRHFLPRPWPVLLMRHWTDCTLTSLRCSFCGDEENGDGYDKTSQDNGNRLRLETHLHNRPSFTV